MNKYDQMRQNFEHYRYIRSGLDGKNVQRIATMSNNEFQRELNAVNALIGDLDMAVSYPSNGNGLSGTNANMLPYAKQCWQAALSLLGVTDMQVTEQNLSRISQLLNDVKNTRSGLLSTRKSFYKYDDDTYSGDSRNAIRNMESAIGYLLMYRDVFKSGGLADELMKLLSGSDSQLSTYYTLVRCAGILRSNYNDETGAITDKFGKAWLYGKVGKYSRGEVNDAMRIADYIIKYNFKTNERDKDGIYATRTRSGDFAKRGSRLDSFVQEANVGAPNALNHVADGADFASSGMSTQQAALTARSLDAQIFNYTRRLKANYGAGSEIDSAINGLDVAKLAKTINFFGVDLQRANTISQQIMGWKADTLKLSKIVNSMTEDEYLEFLMYYLGLDYNMDVENIKKAKTPEWEADEALLREDFQKVYNWVNNKGNNATVNGQVRGGMQNFGIIFPYLFNEDDNEEAKDAAEQQAAEGGV